MLAGAALVLVLLAYLPTLRSFHGVWTGWYTHGYPVAALCLYVLWRDGRSLRAPERGWRWVWLPLLGLSLLWLVAWVLSVQVVHLAVLPMLVLAGATAVFGGAGLRTVLPVAATFLLAVPFWEVLTRPLQLLTVTVNESVLALTGMEATVRAQTITIPYGTFLVAESCAGLGYLVIALVVGAFYAQLFLRRWPARLAAVAAAAALAILGNQVRVFGLIWIGYRSRMASPLMESHGTYGWIVFAVSLLPFFFVARWIEGRERRATGRVGASAVGADPDAAPGRSGGEADGRAGRDLGPADPVDGRDLGSRSPGARRFRRRLAITAGVAVAGPVLLVLLDALPADRRVDPLTPGLEAGQGWQSEDGSRGSVSYAWRPAFSGVDEIRATTWFKAGDTARVDRLIYLEQTQGKELVGSENRIAAGADLLGGRTLGPLGPSERWLQEAVVQAGEERILVWYWYAVAGQVTHSASRAKLLGLEGFLFRDPVAELVAVSAPCRTGDCADVVPLLADLVLDVEARVASDPSTS